MVHLFDLRVFFRLVATKESKERVPSLEHTGEDDRTRFSASLPGSSHGREVDREAFVLRDAPVARFREDESIERSFDLGS